MADAGGSASRRDGTSISLSKQQPCRRHAEPNQGLVFYPLFRIMAGSFFRSGGPSLIGEPLDRRSRGSSRPPRRPIRDSSRCATIPGGPSRGGDRPQSGSIGEARPARGESPIPRRRVRPISNPDRIIERLAWFFPGHAREPGRPDRDWSGIPASPGKSGSGWVRFRGVREPRPSSPARWKDFRLEIG
jgi:hypothetical protein